jgi:ABC-type polysaccharide/polyol phosphate transport system ATPase subunit
MAVLEVRGLSKRYCRSLRRSLAYGALDILGEVVPWGHGHRTLRSGEFWPLDNISFTIEPGQALAVMGGNGAGKSTLLRLIAGLIRPDAGTIRLQGSVGSVIELGGGLDFLLTGRENAELGLQWRNLHPAALREAVAAVQDFAELGVEFDSAVQSYSSGMRSRLAFAIATHLRCDLLLLDEVLAVGDIAFQRKCLRYIQQHLSAGGAMIFVSHNVFQIQTVCQRGLLLDHGRMVFDGSAVDAVTHMFDRADDAAALMVTGDAPLAPLQPSICRIDVLPEIDRASGSLAIFPGSALTLRIDFWMPEAVEALCIVSIWSRDLSICITYLSEEEASLMPAGNSARHCRLPSLPLMSGHYAIRAALLPPDTNLPLAWHGYDDQPTPLIVRSRPDRQALLRRVGQQLVEIEHEWQKAET